MSCGGGRGVINNNDNHDAHLNYLGIFAVDIDALSPLGTAEGTQSTSTTVTACHHHSRHG